jgi:glycine/D-amino acid oxidase-like deaminating enzyme
LVARSGANVIVIGGGIIGTAVAYCLAKRHHKVILLEKQNLAAGASGACDGTLFLQTKTPGPHLEMALKSIALYRTLGEELGYDLEYEPRGGMCLIEDEAQAELMRHTLDQQRQSGLNVELLDIKEARELEPMLGEHLWGATFCAADIQVNPLMVTRGFSRAARQYGADLRLGVAVTDLVITDGRVRGVLTDEGPIYGDCVVNAAAVWAPMLTQKYGYEPPIIPRRGQILVTEQLPPGTVRHLLLCACYLTAKHHPELLDMNQRQHRLGVGLIVEQTRSGGLLLGSTREFVGFDRHTTLDGIKAVADHICRLMPRLGRVNLVRAFAGLRPRTPDGMPILGPVQSLPGLIMAAGHEGDGIALAPITGQIIADCVENMNH